MHTAKTTVVWLSPEARTAKQRRRRLERRYRRTGNTSDKRAHRDAVVAAHDTIMKSRSDSFREQLAEAAMTSAPSGECQADYYTASRQRTTVTKTVAVSRPP